MAETPPDRPETEPDPPQTPWIEVDDVAFDERTGRLPDPLEQWIPIEGGDDAR